MLDVEAVKLQRSRRWLMPNHKCEEFIAHSFWLFIADTFFPPPKRICIFQMSDVFFPPPVVFFILFTLRFVFFSCFGQNNLRYARSNGAMFPFPMVSPFLRDVARPFVAQRCLEPGIRRWFSNVRFMPLETSTGPNRLLI